MSTSYIDLRVLRFLLHEVHDLNALAAYPWFSACDTETADMMLDAAKQFADTVLHPPAGDIDANEPEIVEGVLRVHPAISGIVRGFAEGGWIGGPLPAEHGGMQLSQTLMTAANLIFNAANNAIMGYQGLTTGAANLILTFGSGELKKTYVPAMLEGRWQGTMALTEPQAGSSLSDVTTSATPASDGSYRIRGQKIYISCGDYDQIENVVHLLLARIEGAPAGTKGISLFVVPKYRVQDGGLAPNDVQLAGVYHKMGQKGAPATHLMFGESGDCHGYLVGEAHKGLNYMFQMMNEARLAVGITGAGIASAAYGASKAYAQARPQGRRLQERDLSKPQTLIVNHPDVQRMLLLQQAVVEGAMSLLLYCAKLADLKHVAEGAEKVRAGLLFDLLMPIAKTFPCEEGIRSVSNGLQVFGGGGYCKDFPLERLYRDIRITTIYEGTNGIQGLDLLGRKVMMQEGQAFRLLMEEMTNTTNEASQDPELRPYADQLKALGLEWQQITMLIAGAAKENPATALADATLYLEYAGLAVLAWQWLLLGMTARRALQHGGDPAFYHERLRCMKYVFHYELPRCMGLAVRLKDPLKLTVSEDEILPA